MKCICGVSEGYLKGGKICILTPLFFSFVYTQCVTFQTIRLCKNRQKMNASK